MPGMRPAIGHQVSFNTRGYTNNDEIVAAAAAAAVVDEQRRRGIVVGVVGVLSHARSNETNELSSATDSNFGIAM